MEACGPIAKLLSKQEAVKQILPIVQRLSEVRPAVYKTLVKMRSQLWPCKNECISGCTMQGHFFLMTSGCMGPMTLRESGCSSLRLACVQSRAE